MFQRRRFIQLAGAVATGISLPKFTDFYQLSSIEEALKKWDGAKVTNDEDFWKIIKQAYTVNPNLINLNNGGVSPQPKVVQDAVTYNNQLSNQTPSFYMWRILDQGREPVRSKLAALAGVDPEEIAIQRNSSEALETIIFGIPLEKGDEVILTYQDYPNMINAWKQREKRDGIKLKWVNLELPNEEESYFIRKYQEQITPKTKLLHVTHIINWSGQILPAKKLANLAHEHHAEILLDAAHSFAHIEYSCAELDCDYMGTSLHKWLCAPFGSGMLYVSKEKIGKIYPLLAAPDPSSIDIRKFEHLGTRSFAIEQAIGNAIDFHHLIGSQRKARRLHYLKNYWVEKTQTIPGFRCHTSLDPAYGGAICLFSIDGLKNADIAQKLFSKYKIHCISISWENLEGVRVTPNVYTSLRELDIFVDALNAIVSE